MTAVGSPTRFALELTPAWWIGLDAGHQDVVRAERDARRIADTLLPTASTVCVHAGGGGRVLLSYELPDHGVPTPDQLASLVLDEGAGITVLGADGCIDVALGDIDRRRRAALAARALLLRTDGVAVRFQGSAEIVGIVRAESLLTTTAIERLDAGAAELGLSSKVIVTEPVAPSFCEGLLTLALEPVGEDSFRPVR